MFFLPFWSLIEFSRHLDDLLFTEYYQWFFLVIIFNDKLLYFAVSSHINHSKSLTFFNY